MKFIAAYWEDVFTFIPTIRFTDNKKSTYKWILSLDWLRFSVAIAKTK